MAPRGVLLDVDGTLVDSNDSHALAWVRALREAGTEVPFSRIRYLIGMGGDKLLPRAAGISPESAEGQRISKRRSEIFKNDYLPALKAFPGATALLKHMRDNGFRMVAASSAEKEELMALLRICRADGLIEARISSDDADESKPSPDIVHAALANIRLAPDEAIMLGDTPYDIEAATAARVKTIAFRCGGWEDKDLAGAAAIYNDPCDLLGQFDRSPLAART
jgi:HAD superfamily hydrolase (TIGR01509 family)